MNYYGARQKQDTKKWDYTCRNDDRIWPVGYCGGWKEYNKEDVTKRLGEGMYDGLVREQNQSLPFKSKYHTDGHDTKEAACSCYRAYLLDQKTRFGEQQNQQKKCEVCQKWTQKFAETSMDIHYLCEEHLNKETLEKIFPEVAEIISSY